MGVRINLISKQVKMKQVVMFLHSDQVHVTDFKRGERHVLPATALISNPLNQPKKGDCFQ